MHGITLPSPFSIASGAILLALAAVVPPLIATGTSAATSGMACANADLVYQPQSAFPDTARGRVFYRQQFINMEYAMLCMVNEFRAQEQRPPLHRVILLRGTTARGIRGAAADHARASAQQRWWGTVAQVPGCRPYPPDPTRCDPHYDPVSKTDPVQRAKNNNYGSSCPTWSVGENTYTGWGNDKVTPRAAFEFWKNSPLHRENMLRPEFVQIALGTETGSADPNAPADFYPAITFVQMLGSCG
ncbi:CAP domain-containing protein [Nonomuraea roseoviolacea]